MVSASLAKAAFILRCSPRISLPIAWVMAFQSAMVYFKLAEADFGPTMTDAGLTEAIDAGIWTKPKDNHSIAYSTENQLLDLWRLSSPWSIHPWLRQISV